MSDSDEALLLRSATGDEQAFASLLERYRDPVSRLVRSSLGPRSLWAEDVVQEVFVQVHRSAPTYEGRSSFRTWLYGIVVNLCRDHRRRLRTAPVDRTIDPDHDGVLAAIPDVSLDPLERLERDERAALVVAAVKELSPAHRVVLHLRDGEEMRYEEIAEVLAVPVGTVRSRLHNARAALAKELAARLRR